MPNHLEALDEAAREAVLAATEANARPALWHDGAWSVDYRRLRVVAEVVPAG